MDGFRFRGFILSSCYPHNPATSYEARRILERVDQGGLFPCPRRDCYDVLPTRKAYTCHIHTHLIHEGYVFLPIERSTSERLPCCGVTDQASVNCAGRGSSTMTTKTITSPPVLNSRPSMRSAVSSLVSGLLYASRGSRAY